MDVGNIIQVIATTLAAAGLFFTAYEILILRKQQRLATLDFYWEKFWSNPKIVDIFYRIEHNGFMFPDKFKLSEVEKALDNLLGLMQNIAVHNKLGLLSNDDMKHLAYHVFRVCRNSEVRRYFAFLDDHCSRYSGGRHPFKDAEEMAVKLENVIS
jgi:hypothetical protein